MPGSGEMPAGEDRVPVLAAGMDPTTLSLEPEEGYVLSRIDGHTPISLLRQIGGVPPEQVDRCIEKLVKEGAIEFVSGSSGSAQPDGEGAQGEKPGGQEKTEKKSESGGGTAMKSQRRIELPPAQVDDTLDLDVEFQQKVLDFEGRLDGAYHEILGVAPTADTREIKRAYFQLSKQYHPDRYFRRNTGDFGAHIEAIFKRVLEAYELLSDPTTRAEVQKSLESEPVVSEERPIEAGDKPRASGRRLTLRLTQLAAHRRMREERRRKAKSFFESGMSAFRKERWMEAAGSVRLAIAFDPHNEAYRGAFIDVQRKAYDERAKILLKEADGAHSLGDYRDAHRLYGEAVHYRPADAELNFKTARLGWKLGEDLRAAKEHAQAACEIEPDNGNYRRVLGQIYKAAGLAANAKRELQAAVRLDSSDAEAKAELKSL